MEAPQVKTSQIAATQLDIHPCFSVSQISEYHDLSSLSTAFEKRAQI